MSIQLILCHVVGQDYSLLKCDIVVLNVFNMKNRFVPNESVVTNVEK